MLAVSDFMKEPFSSSEVVTCVQSRGVISIAGRRRRLKAFKAWALVLYSVKGEVGFGAYDVTTHMHLVLSFYWFRPWSYLCSNSLMKTLFSLKRFVEKCEL